MKTLQATVRQQGEGERAWFAGGGLFTWKVTESESGGAFLMVEVEMAQGKVTPLHIHPHADETFYVIEGEILLNLDGEQRTAGAGSVVMMPRGLPHAFMVTSPAARLLNLHTPGGGEDFYRLACDPVVDGAEPTPVDFGRVAAAAEASDSIEILGPPPF